MQSELCAHFRQEIGGAMSSFNWPLCEYAGGFRISGGETRPANSERQTEEFEEPEVADVSCDVVDRREIGEHCVDQEAPDDLVRPLPVHRP